MNESSDFPKTLAVVLSTRVSVGPNKRIECLCLAPGKRRMYRLYSTSNVDLTEQYGDDDLEPVEFNMVSDISVATFLIESFWRLRISPTELEQQLSRIDPVTRSAAN